jgi:hypothetical protein
VLQKRAQVTARPHDLRRHLVQVDVALIMQDDAALCVEHTQALRHVVDRVRQLTIFRAQAMMQNGENYQRSSAQAHEQKCMACNS